MVDPIFWRFAGALSDSAERLMFEGSNPWELDEALVASGFQMGLCEMQDLYGIDTIHARKRAIENPLPVVPRMLQEGRFGKKYGVGWYRYPGGGGCVIDPLIEDLIREEAHFAKIPRREVPDSEIVETISLTLHNTVQSLSQDDGDETRIIKVLKNDLGVPKTLIDQCFKVA